MGKVTEWDVGSMGNYSEGPLGLVGMAQTTVNIRRRTNASVPTLGLLFSSEFKSPTLSHTSRQGWGTLF